MKWNKPMLVATSLLTLSACGMQHGSEMRTGSFDMVDAGYQGRYHYTDKHPYARQKPYDSGSMQDIERKHMHNCSPGAIKRGDCRCGM